MSLKGARGSLVHLALDGKGKLAATNAYDYAKLFFDEALYPSEKAFAVGYAGQLTNLARPCVWATP
jgi:hypothetical protein